MPPKFGANLGPNAGAADGSANTFGAGNGPTPASAPTPTDTPSPVDAPTLGTTPTSTDMPTSDNMSASSNTSVSALVGEPANDQNSAFSSPTLAGGQPASGLNTQNPFANKVIASGPDSHPAHTQASGSGDIILKPEKTSPRSRKKLLIFGAIIIGILAVIIMLIVFLSGGGNNIQKTKTAWLEYQAALIDGAGEDDIDLQGGWYIERLMQESSDDNIESSSYSDTLNERYNNFLENFEHSSLHKDNALSQSIEAYTEVFRATKLILDLPRVTTNYEEIYVNEGQEAADNYLQSVLPDNAEGYSGMPKTVIDSVQQYFDIERQIYSLYQENNCIVDAILDTECAARIEGEISDGGQLTQLYADLEGLRTFIDSYSDVLASTLVSLTTENTKLLGADDEQ